jgi:hypothetical protein
MRHKVLRAALFLLPVLILLPYLDLFPFHPSSVYSDLMISHYPNALFLQRSIIEEHSVPLWSSNILSGYPFAANPLSGLFYPPGWLALLFPLNWGFNLTVVLHLIWGGVGLFLYLRSEGLPESPALFGALLFEAMPKLYAHLGAGHLTLLYAVPWTPWLFLAEKRSVTASGFWRFCLPGLVLGVIVLADIRWAAYAGLAWLAIVAWTAFRAQDGLLAGIKDALLRVGVNLGAAFVSASALLLPLIEYTRLSTRAFMLPDESLIESLNPAQWLGLIYPYIQGPAESMLYPGGLVIAMFVLAVLFPNMRRRAPFWMWMITITLFMALGHNFPPAVWLSQIPGFHLLRVPPRVLFLTGFAFAIVAANVFHSMISSGPHAGHHVRRKMTALVLFSLLVFAILFGLAVVFFVDQVRVQLQFAWGAVTILISAAAIFLAYQRRISPALAGVIFFVLALSDLLAVNSLGLSFRPASQVLSDPTAAVVAMVANAKEGPFRVYSPSYSLPQQAAAQYRLELADGVDPLMLSDYQKYMEGASGVPSKGYSVTLPPFANDPTSDNRFFLPDPDRLGLLNVRYIVSEFDLPVNGLNLVMQTGQSRVYENLQVRPRAWVQDIDSPAGQNIRPAQIISREANHIELQAGGPGLLVLSEIAYPGWSVIVDGQPSEMQIEIGMLRAVELGSGVHDVTFVFRPMSVYVGVILSAATWLAALAASIGRLQRRNHARFSL